MTSYFPIILIFFKKSTQTKEIIEKETRETDETDKARIRCPLCLWQPRATDEWFCGSVGHPEYLAKGCGTSWNTFKTHGKCPGCAHQWRWTSCLRCGQWSRHKDWYQ